jgi:hypothetical protein
MKGEPLFPVIVKDGEFEPPASDAYYVLAEGGLYLERRTDLFTACVPVHGGVPGLLPHPTRLTIHLPRLPCTLLERAVGFFRAVYERCRGEAILTMFYAAKTRRYAFAPPPQVISGRLEGGRFRAELRLEYSAMEKPGPEYLKIGTFHSHGHASPAHSSIDVHDEMFDAGLHLTAGYVNSSRPEFSAAFVVGRTRFTVPVADVLPPFHAARRPPPSWLDQVLVRIESGASYGGSWTGPSYQRPPADERTPWASPRLHGPGNGTGHED